MNERASERMNKEYIEGGRWKKHLGKKNIEHIFEKVNEDDKI